MRNSKKEIEVTEIKGGYVLTWEDREAENIDRERHTAVSPTPWPRKRFEGTEIFTDKKKLIDRIKRIL